MNENEYLLNLMNHESNKAILPNLKGNSKLAIIRHSISILNLSKFTKSHTKVFKGFFLEFGNIDKFSIEFGYQIIANFEFTFNSEELLY